MLVAELFSGLSIVDGSPLMHLAAHHEPIPLPKLDAAAAFGLALAKVHREPDRRLIIRPSEQLRLDDVAGNIE